MSRRINIVIIEPSPIIRCGIATMLQQATADTPNVTISESVDLASVIAQSHIDTPDLLIINSSHMGLFSPTQLRADIGREELSLIALQSSFHDQSLLQNYDEVISIYDSAESIKEKIEAITIERDEQKGKKEISTREREIIVCVVKGLTNKQIADTLNLSTHTVIAHRRNIATKLQIHSPSGLTIYAIVNKLVDLSEIKNSITRSSEE